MLTTQTLPAAAEAYAADQRAVLATTVARVRSLWRRVGADFDTGWSRIELDALAVVASAQLDVALAAQAYVPDVLTETGARSAARPVAAADPSRLIGVAGDGRPLETLLYGAVTHAKERVALGAGPAEALLSGGRWLSMTTSTVLSDTGRQSEALAMGVRPRVTGYVRMLNPPSCARCVVLAGARYRSSTAFARHPRCDCRHVPAADAVLDDMTMNAGEYFESLSRAEQDRVFTSAGAQAIRDGADLNQVVNARRGMRPAQIGGRRMLVTSEGTTRRGIAYSYLAPSGTRLDRSQTAVRITRNGPEARTIERRVANRPRLMPETIREVATDQADYLRLLRANGYLRG